MLFNCRIIVLFAVSCAALESLRPHSYSSQTDLTSRSNSDIMLSYTYRSQPSEQQPVPRMLSTRSSTGQEGYLFHPGNVRVNVVIFFLRLNPIFKCHQYDDHGTSFGNSESGATVACSPQAITMDEFECLHDSRHFPPAPSTNAPTVFTIDPKQLDRQAPPLIQGDESQGHASDHKDDPQSHASPSKLSQPEVRVMFSCCVFSE